MTNLIRDAQSTETDSIISLWSPFSYVAYKTFQQFLFCNLFLSCNHTHTNTLFEMVLRFSFSFLSFPSCQLSDCKSSEDALKHCSIFGMESLRNPAPDESSSEYFTTTLIILKHVLMSPFDCIIHSHSFRFLLIFNFSTETVPPMLLVLCECQLCQLRFDVVMFLRYVLLLFFRYDCHGCSSLSLS